MVPRSVQYVSFSEVLPTKELREEVINMAEMATCTDNVHTLVKSEDVVEYIEELLEEGYEGENAMLSLALLALQGYDGLIDLET